MKYLPRLIDTYLESWVKSPSHKPILLRGARQVGKSWAVRHLGERFDYFIEINFEKNPEYKSIFSPNLDVERILSQLSVISGKPVVDGKTLLFLDEIQDCREAIMALRFFKENRPNLHVIAAGSLLEFTLAEIPTFGVGRVHSMFMYPMTFDEFLMGNGQDALMKVRDEASTVQPLPEIFHHKLIELFRTYMIIGGMPEAVAKWVHTRDFIQCQEVLNDLLTGYEDDFAKYRKKVAPELLRNTFRSVTMQLTEKFTYSEVPGGYKTYEVKRALELLAMAGLITCVYHTDANGLPLGSETDSRYCKILPIDPGLTLRSLSLFSGVGRTMEQHILTMTATDLVNKGPITELIAGLELLRYQSPNIRHELFYWTRRERNSVAEVDYVTDFFGGVLPIEIKAGVQGGMKSLWMLMRLKKLGLAVRSSLENFGVFQRLDSEDEDAVRDVLICPLYALSQLPRLLASLQDP